ncbi:hypothetical protein CFP56_003961 [Quercus suber]|uniref:Disease resistance protein At4g27190-like leucine-rich repeats domain-containing protein n=1 Tax=Quercus suber TaxID=58331 RepID=A0AAW0LBX7_QUESU
MKFLKCHGLKSIKFSGLIKAMSIEVELNDDLERVELEASNLCRVSTLTLLTCVNSNIGRNVIPFSSNALALSEVTYQMLKPPLDIAPWNVEKIEFLTKLGKSKKLTLTSTSAKDLVIPKKLRDSLPSPSYNVKQLKVETSHPRTGQEIVELVDSLLWISPLPEILIIRHRINMEPWMTFKCYYCFALFQFSYEKPIIEGEKPSCCKFLPIPCWRHCLKSVMIENFRLSADEETQKADEESLEKYFHENTESLESFQFLSSGIASYVVFPNLEELEIKGMDNMKMIWSNQLISDCFGKLETMTVSGCTNLTNIVPHNMLRTLRNLKELEVFEIQGTNNVEESRDIAAAELISLTLRNLEKVKHVWSMDPQGIITFAKLDAIEISGCSSLRSVFPTSMAKALMQLEKLRIINCATVEEIVAKEEGIETTSLLVFPQLTRLTLLNLPELKSFYRGKHILKWPLLNHLWITSCDKLKIFGSTESSDQETNGLAHHANLIQQPLFFIEKYLTTVRNEDIVTFGVILFRWAIPRNKFHLDWYIFYSNAMLGRNKFHLSFYDTSAHTYSFGTYYIEHCTFTIVGLRGFVGILHDDIQSFNQATAGHGDLHYLQQNAEC